MKIIKRIFLIVLVLCFYLCLSTVASAHTRYEWDNDETRNLIRHFLTSVAHPHLREKPIEYLSEIFDQQILMIRNEKIDKKMIYDAVEKIHSRISPDIFPEVKRMLDDYLHSIK